MTLTNDPPEDARMDSGVSIPARALRSLGRVSLAVWVSIAIALAVNAVFAGAYLWSRGGQETNVRVEVRGNQFTAWLDGKQIIQERFNELPASGGVNLILDPTTSIPSLPHPRGIDWIRVTDLDTREVVYEDDFSSFDATNKTLRGTPIVEDGHIAAKSLIVIGPFGPGDWTDIRIDANFDNIVGGGIIARADGLTTGAQLSFRPFRHLDGSVQVLDEGKVVEAAGAPRLEASRSEVMRSLLSMTLRGYPPILAAFMALLAVVVVVQFVPVPAWPRRAVADAPAEPRDRPPWLAFITNPAVLWWALGAAIALGAVITTAYLNNTYNERLPHVPDEVSYIFQGRVLASGHLSVPPPKVEESFEFFFPALITASDGKWASIYPFGHPLVLAIGLRLGILWLIPPIVGGLSVLLTFAIGSKIFNRRVGLLAALIFAASPFFMMTASNYMSHNTAALYIAASLCCVVYRHKRTILLPALGGVFFGLLLNTRPLTAVALVLPFAVMLLCWLIPSGNRVGAAKSVAAFALGGASMLLAYGLYNLGTTGEMFKAGYSTGGDLNAAVGFSGPHTPGLGMQNEQTQLASLLLVFNGWPQALGLMLVLAPFVLGTRNRWDWIILACAVAVIGIYTLYEATGLMHGPRYWYEGMPFLVLLAARGAELLAARAAAIAGALRSRITANPGQPFALAAVIVFPIVVVLTVLPANDWLRGDGLGFSVDAVPASATDLRGFNGLNDRMVTSIDDQHLHHALVLVDACANWQCFGAVFWKNKPTLDGNIVYAKNLPGRNQRLFELYPDRPVYQALYSGEVFPYGAKPGSNLPPPVASDIPPPTPVPTPTIAPQVIADHDAQRRADLAQVAQGLQQYLSATGSYPLAEGVQTLCAYPFDAACALRDYIDMPADPTRGATYWYQSDGRTFTVYAAMEGSNEGADCPDPAPEHLATIARLYCVRGSPP